MGDDLIGLGDPGRCFPSAPDCFPCLRLAAARRSARDTGLENSSADGGIDEFALGATETLFEVGDLCTGFGDLRHLTVHDELKRGNDLCQLLMRGRGVEGRTVVRWSATRYALCYSWRVVMRSGDLNS
jgi:hypothetical protein